MAAETGRPFEILVREHEPALFAFVQSVGVNAAAAEDVVQESFLAAWQALDAYDERTPFAAWLRGIARNKILAHQRGATTAQRHVRMLDASQLEAVANEFGRLVPGRAEVLSDTLAALRACLGSLSESNRALVAMVYEHCWGCDAIARHLMESVVAVRKRVQRARAQLRACVLGKL